MYIARLSTVIHRGFEYERTTFKERQAREVETPWISAIRLADSDRDWYDWIVGDELTRALGVVCFESDEAFDAFCAGYPDYDLAVGDLNKQRVVYPIQESGSPRNSTAPRLPRTFTTDLLEFLNDARNPRTHVEGNPRIGRKRPERPSEEFDTWHDEYMVWWQNKADEVSGIIADITGEDGDDVVLPGVQGFARRFSAMNGANDVIYHLKRLGASCDEILGALDALNPLPIQWTNPDVLEQWDRFDWFESSIDDFHRLRGCVGGRFAVIGRRLSSADDKDEALEKIYSEAEASWFLRADYEVNRAIRAFMSASGHYYHYHSGLPMVEFIANEAFLSAYEVHHEFVCEIIESGAMSIWTLIDNVDLLDMWADAYSAGVPIEDVVGGFETCELRECS